MITELAWQNLHIHNTPTPWTRIMKIFNTRENFAAQRRRVDHWYGGIVEMKRQEVERVPESSALTERAMLSKYFGPSVLDIAAEVCNIVATKPRLAFDLA